MLLWLFATRPSSFLRAQISVSLLGTFQLCFDFLWSLVHTVLSILSAALFLTCMLKMARPSSPRAFSCRPSYSTIIFSKPGPLFLWIPDEPGILWTVRSGTDRTALDSALTTTRLHLPFTMRFWLPMDNWFLSAIFSFCMAFHLFALASGLLHFWTFIEILPPTGFTQPKLQLLQDGTFIRLSFLCLKKHDSSSLFASQTASPHISIHPSQQLVDPKTIHFAFPLHIPGCLYRLLVYLVNFPPALAFWFEALPKLRLNQKLWTILCLSSSPKEPPLWSHLVCFFSFCEKTSHHFPFIPWFSLNLYRQLFLFYIKSCTCLDLNRGQA